VLGARVKRKGWIASRAEASVPRAHAIDVPDRRSA
jgi:hypothetical protein